MMCPNCGHEMKPVDTKEMLSVYQCPKCESLYQRRTKTYWRQLELWDIIDKLDFEIWE